MEMPERFIISCVFILFSSQLFAEPVEVNSVRKVAATVVKSEAKRAEKMALKLNEQGKYQLAQNPYVLGTTKEIKDDYGEVLAYVTELEPQGFIITSADSDTTPVLGYSFKGNFLFEESKQNVLMHLVKWDVQARKKTIKMVNHEIKTHIKSNNILWDKYISSDVSLVESIILSTSWGPWITTNWAQSGIIPGSTDIYFNDMCPLVKSDTDGPKCLVGCTATAVAQILNYWEYPASVSFDSSDAYTSNGQDQNKKKITIRIPEDANKYGFLDFSSLSTMLTNINFSNPYDIAYLCFGIGVKISMDYGANSSGASTWDARSALLNGFGYGSANFRPYWWKQTGIDNIKKEWPFIIDISGKVDNEDSRHTVIVDGYRSDDFFHINTGWSDIYSDTWYNLPSIQTTVYGHQVFYDTITSCVLDICPYQGWHQWGADSKNSQYSVYNIPSSVDSINWDKWHVTPQRSRYKFKGMVIGTGNKVYASVSTMDLGSYQSYIYIVDQYGIKAKEIALSDALYGLNYPVQLPKGDVFITSGDGGLYKIDPKTEARQKTFTLPLKL